MDIKGYPLSTYIPGGRNAGREMCIRDSIKGVNPETEEQETRPSSDDAPFAALAFKIATDPFVGKLAYFRVYSGKVEAGTTVYNSCLLYTSVL